MGESETWKNKAWGGCVRATDEGTVRVGGTSGTKRERQKKMGEEGEETSATRTSNLFLRQSPTPAGHRPIADNESIKNAPPLRSVPAWKRAD